MTHSAVITMAAKTGFWMETRVIHMACPDLQREAAAEGEAVAPEPAFATGSDTTRARAPSRRLS